ncbi:hypothetical protein Q8A73_010760 [Channa argus]|nr:hypothetical protein Q8A73_010760 [Channa argus]
MSLGKYGIFPNVLQSCTFIYAYAGFAHSCGSVRQKSPHVVACEVCFLRPWRITQVRWMFNSTVAPMSSVLLVSECMSQGEMRVSCSSEGGDSPQYSWTLDGHTLTDAELLSGNNELTTSL